MRIGKQLKVVEYKVGICLLLYSKCPIISLYWHFILIMNTENLVDHCHIATVNNTFSDFIYLNKFIYRSYTVLLNVVCLTWICKKFCYKNVNCWFWFEIRWEKMVFCNNCAKQRYVIFKVENVFGSLQMRYRWWHRHLASNFRIFIELNYRIGSSTRCGSIIQNSSLLTDWSNVVCLGCEMSATYVGVFNFLSGYWNDGQLTIWTLIYYLHS